MRVYEFSKKSGISTKELLDALDRGGFSITSHMSVIPQEAIDFLNKNFKLTSSDQLEKATDKKATENKMTIQQVQKEKLPLGVMAEVSKEAEPAKPAFKQTPPVFRSESAAPTPTAIPVAEGGREFSAVMAEPITLESMSVAALAEKLKKPIAEVMVTLIKWGIVAAKNQILPEDVVARVARHYEVDVVPKQKELIETEEKGTLSSKDANQVERPPVVVVLGHVDHGKTTLLDFIRKTRVAAREKGGITQHLGAYEATTPQGNIIFIDTPGHEAFSKMRMRGIKVADIVILVVAADDSVMPQTVEAIKQAKSMGVPIIIAINKMDKVDTARLDVVKRDLAQHDLLPEEWGGDVVLAPISAKTGQGVDQLLDMVILQSQLMELKASITGLAKGYVLESKLEKGRGPVATILCQHGILKVGDFFVCGTTHGRVSSLVDSHGNRINQAKPAIPVLVAGFSELPNAGDYFQAVSQQDYRAERARAVEPKPSSPGLSFLKKEAINIIIKTDTNSSKEALLGSIHKLSKKFEKKFNIVYSGIGDISESDVDFAATTGATLIALHVKAEPNAMSLAQKQLVTIKLYDIIYKLLEDLEAIAEGAKAIKMVRTKIGEAIVRQVFNIKGLGVIAGSYVNDGRFSKDGTVVVLRGNRKVGEGKIKSLQRDKKAVKEVHAGYECGFLVDGFDAWEVDDRVECYLEVPEQVKK